MAVSQAELNIIIKAIKQGSGLKEINQELDTVGRTSGNATAALGNISNVLGALGIGVGLNEIIQFGQDSVAAAKESAAAEAELATVLKSSGQAANDYQGELTALATALQNTTNFTDEQISHAQSLLLTYDLIGRETMPRAVAAVADLAELMDGDVQGASTQVGKALQGQIEALTRSGVSFSDQQKEQVEALFATNRAAEAQAIILGQLEKQVGGQAAAAREAAGASQDLAVSFGNLQESVGGLILSLGNSQVGENVVIQMDRIKASVDAYIFVLNEAIPAIQANDAALAAQAAQTITTAQSYDELEAATDAAAKNVDAFQSALLSNVSTHEEYKAAVDKVAESNIFLAGQLDLTADAFDAAKASISAAADVAAGNAYQSMRKLTSATYEAAQAARQLSDAQDTSAANAAQQAANQNLLAAKEAAPELGARITENRAAVFQMKEDERIANEQRAKQNEQAAKAAMKPFVDATKEFSSQIASAVSSSVSAGESWVNKALGIDDDGAARAEEGVRRMAAVALGGLADVNTQQLATQLKGVDAAAAFVQAVTGGNDAAVKEEARKLATQPIIEMFDANVIAGQIEQQLRAQQLKEQLDAKVNAILGEKGLQGIQNVTTQVQGAVTTAGTAATEVTGQVAGVGTSAEATGKQVATAFNAAIAPVDILNERLKLMAGLLDRVGFLAKTAGGGIAGLNPPGVPTDAQRKTGGATPL